MKTNECERCGEQITDIDAGFSPADQGMAHGGCGGRWVRVEISDDNHNTAGVEYARQREEAAYDEYQTARAVRD